MSHKSQISEKKSMEGVSRSHFHNYAAELPNENPLFVAVPRKPEVAAEVKQASLVKTKMADNLDRSKVVPVATSYKGTVYQMEFAQTINIRRSLDASMLKINTGGKPRVDSSLVSIKGPKRSQTPLPPSIDECGKKRKIAAPRLLSGTPPEVAPKKPKHDIEILKKSNNSTVVKGDLVRFPLSESNGQAPTGPKKGGGSSVAAIGERRVEILERCATAMVKLSDDDKFILDSLEDFYKHYMDHNAQVGKQSLDLETIDTEKHWDCEKQKRRLNAMSGKIESLKERLSQEIALKKDFEQKYMRAQKARAICENNLEDRKQATKLLTDQREAVLRQYQSQIACLKVEINNIRDTNRGMANLLGDKKIKLKQTQETVQQLSEQNKKLAAALKDRNLKMQDMVAKKKAFESKMSKVESQLKQKNLLCIKLAKGIEEFRVLQLVAQETEDQLQLILDEENEVKRLLAEMEAANISLNERVKQLENVNISLAKINEEFGKEIDAEKVKASMELKNKKEAYGDEITKLNSTLNQKELDLAKLLKSYEDLKEANRHQIAVHNGELRLVEMKNVKMKEVNESLECKLHAQAQNLQAAQTENQQLKETIDRLQLVTSEFEGDKKRFAARIATLQSDIEERDGLSKAQQEAMLSLESKYQELEKSVSRSKAEKKQIANELAVAKKDFEELKVHADNIGSELNRLQKELEKKNTKLIGVKHEKNSVISQLNQKMHVIGSVFDQPIHTTTMVSSRKANKTSKMSRDRLQQEPNAATDDISSSVKKRRSQRTAFPVQYASDYASENDDVPHKLRFAKPRKMAVVKPSGDGDDDDGEVDVFDTLMKMK